MDFVSRDTEVVHSTKFQQRNLGFDRDTRLTRWQSVKVDDIPFSEVHFLNYLTIKGPNFIELHIKHKLRKKINTNQICLSRRRSIMGKITMSHVPSQWRFPGYLLCRILLKAGYSFEKLSKTSNLVVNSNIISIFTTLPNFLCNWSIVKEKHPLHRKSINKNHQNREFVSKYQIVYEYQIQRCILFM